MRLEQNGDVFLDARRKSAKSGDYRVRQVKVELTAKFHTELMAAPAMPATHHNECCWVNSKVAMPTFAIAPKPQINANEKSPLTNLHPVRRRSW